MTKTSARRSVAGEFLRGPISCCRSSGLRRCATRPSIYVDAQTDLRVALDLDSTTEWTLVGLSFVNRRAKLLPFDPAFDAAYDRYAFIRDAWLQRREYQVKDGQVPGGEITPEELEELERELELEEPATPEIPEDQSAARPGRYEQLRHVADARERRDGGRHVPVAEGPARLARRDGPFEQQGQTRAVDPRSTFTRSISACFRLPNAASPSPSRRAASSKPRSPETSKRPGPMVASAAGSGAGFSSQVLSRHRDSLSRGVR